MDQQTIQILSYVWPIIVIQLGIQLYALVDVIKKKKTKVLTMPIWIAIIVFGNLLGAVAYLLLGKTDDTSD